MQQFRGDLHIHTVLSPCGDLEMSPERIISEAKKQKLDFIGISDHNSTLNCEVISKVGQREGIFVLPGCEATTCEEVHVLTFFEGFDTLRIFQQYLDEHLLFLPNNPEILGYQLVVDEQEQILQEEERFLGTALTVGIEQLEQKVHELGGLVIPAHVDRPRNSLFSQLAFLPEGVRFDALQISKSAEEQPVREKYCIGNDITIVRFSDAHYPENIGEVSTFFEMEELSFSEIKQALHKTNKRKTRLT